jgi:hypothetical protein
VTTSRKRRGAASERHVAAYLRDHGWPHATAVGAGRGGADILHTNPAAIEVKSRYGLDLVAWLRQARRNANGQVPVLIVRNNGQGEASIDDWSFVTRFADGVRLLRLATVLGQVSDALAMRDDPDSIKTFVDDHLADLHGPVQLQLFNPDTVA